MTMTTTIRFEQRSDNVTFTINLEKMSLLEQSRMYAWLFNYPHQRHRKSFNDSVLKIMMFKEDAVAFKLRFNI
jgi:hypothetical protein